MSVPDNHQALYVARAGYEAPALFALGTVEEVTLGGAGCTAVDATFQISGAVFPCAEDPLP